MASPLKQTTVAILEHRFTKEFSSLLERFGISVYACPLLEEKPIENRAELEDFVRQAAAGNLGMMIFLTGVGARFLTSAAESIGLKDQFLQSLNKMTIVVIVAGLFWLGILLSLSMTDYISRPWT